MFQNVKFKVGDMQHHTMQQGIKGLEVDETDLTHIAILPLLVSS